MITFAIVALFATAQALLAGLQTETKDCPSNGADQPPVDEVDEVSDLDFVELERGVCFGPCPGYVIQIRAAGEVSWIGKAWVMAKGRRSDRVPPRAARALIAKFQTKDFWRLCKLYTHDVHDESSSTTRVRIGGSFKFVVDYGFQGPPFLWKLNNEIDSLAKTEKWIGKVRSGP